MNKDIESRVTGKKDFSNTKFKKHIRITEEDWMWIKENKIEGGMAVFLEHIINQYRENYYSEM